MIAQTMGQMMAFSGQLIVPFAQYQTRVRRGAVPPVSSLDLSAIKSALAAFDNTYYTPQLNTGIQIEFPEVVEPTAVAQPVESEVRPWKDRALKMLRKFVTLETYDPVNGEIFVRVVLKVNFL